MKLIEMAILLFCAWNSAELLNSWQHSPIERWSWLVLLLWTSPLILYYLQPSLFPRKKNVSTTLLTLALCLALLGSIGSLNTLSYFSLAMALAALLPPSPHKIGWIALAITWMPAFGWLGSYLLYDYILVVRLALATVGAAWMAAALALNAKEPSNL